MESRLNLRHSKKYLQAIAAIVIFVLGSQVWRIAGSVKTEPTQDLQVQFSEITPEIPKLDIAEFDPNTLSATQWQQIGFSEKQASTILKYKEVVGGEFRSKAQLKKCYAISEEKFLQLEPFILLPNAHENSTTNFTKKNFAKPELKVFSPFNPDQYSAAEWVALGFSDKQAAAILKYKQFLGGSFISKEKFKECFVISPENYSKLRNYLLLPETAPAKNKYRYSNNSGVVQSKPDKLPVQLRNFDPNSLDIAGWQNLGFSEKQAQVIINYKNSKLKGNFKNLEEIQKCFVISADKFEQLKPYIVLQNSLSTENYDKTQISVPVAKAQTDFGRTDLNTIGFKELTEFGFTEKAAGSFIGFRKSLGDFVNKNQIFEVYGIDRETAEKLVSVAPLDAKMVQKYTLATAPESWLKTHPYFKYSADKIIYYRISEQDDKKIWKSIKTKPEYEAKMRLYLK